MIKHYTTLWDIMKSFDPLEFMGLTYNIGMTHAVVVPPIKQKANSSSPSGKRISNKEEKGILSFYRRFEKTCIKLDLHMSAKAARRLINEVSEYSLTYGEFHELCQELKRRLRDEMELMAFYSVEPSKKDFLTNENPFGDAVAEAFPSAIEDIKNAAKCLAFDQWTASVLHSMRVLEIGLGVLATKFRIAFDRPDWNDLINRINKEIGSISKATSGDGWKTEEQFYSEAALHLKFVKNAWRNHAMHVRDTYDEARAETIFRHTQEFMTHLATKLKEDTA